MAEYIDREAAMSVPVLPKEYRKYQTANVDAVYENGWNDALNNPPPKLYRKRYLNRCGGNGIRLLHSCGRTMALSWEKRKNNENLQKPFCIKEIIFHTGCPTKGGENGSKRNEGICYRRN